MPDELIDIPRSELEALRELYKRDWPTYHISHNTIDNFIKWFEKEPNIKNLHIYSLNGDWTDGTFVVADRFQLLFGTLNENQERLISALSLFDYSRGYILSGFNKRLYPIVLEFLKRRNVDPNILKGSTTMWYFMPKEECAKFDVCPPKDITIKPLAVEHASIVNEVWPFRANGTIFFLQRLIRLNPNLGAFTDDGELVAWCLRLTIGSLGILQVKESYKRRGFGSLMVKAMAKLFSDLGYDTYAPVVEDNTPSRKMFEKLGFKIIDQVFWTLVDGNIPSLWDTEE